MRWELNESQAKTLKKELKNLDNNGSTDISIIGNEIFYKDVPNTIACKINIPDSCVYENDEKEYIVGIEKMINFCEEGKIVFGESQVKFVSDEVEAYTSTLTESINRLDISEVKTSNNLKEINTDIDVFEEGIKKCKKFVSEPKVKICSIDSKLVMKSDDKTDGVEVLLDDSHEYNDTDVNYGDDVIRYAYPRVIREDCRIYTKTDSPLLIEAEKGEFEFKLTAAPLIME